MPLPRRPLTALAGAAAATGLVAVLSPAAALAAPVPKLPVAPPALGAPAATVRTAQLSPGAPHVDIYLSALSGGTTSLAAGAESYGQVSSYSRINPGLYTVAVRAAGSPAGSPPMLTQTVDARAQDAYTVATVGVGAARRVTVLRDDLTPPAAGTARVRLIQASSAAGNASVVANGTLPVATAAPFAAATSYAQVPAGTWPLAATSISTAGLGTHASVSLAAGSVTSLVLLDRAGGGVTLHATLDAAGAAVIPSGGVQTGGGGLAAPAKQHSSPAAPLLLALLGGAGLAVFARRRSAQNLVGTGRARARA